MSKYDSSEKARARDIPLRIAERLPAGSRVLDLYGGGGSTRPLAAMPLEITAAERDVTLHAKLVEDSVAYGFIPLLGDFSRAPGCYSLINLDLNGALGEESLAAVRKAAEMLDPAGYLVVTLTGAREKDGEFGVRRSLMIPTLLAAEAEMRYVLTMTYRGIANVPMWVTVLVPHGRTLARLHIIRRTVESQGWWTADYFGWLMGERRERARQRAKTRAHRRARRTCAYSECVRSIPAPRSKFCSDECGRFFHQRDRQRAHWTTLRMTRPARPCALSSCRGTIPGAAYGQRKFCTTRCRNKAYYLPHRSPPRAPRMSDCHPDRRHYARGLCERCCQALYERERRTRVRQAQEQIAIAA